MATEQAAPSIPSTGATMVPGATPPSGLRNTQKTPTQRDHAAKGKKSDAAPEVTKNVTPEPEAPAKKQYKVKMNNEEIALDLDDTETQTYIQKGYGADKTFQEAARLRKEAEEIRTKAERDAERVKKETDKYLKDMGIDPRQFAEQFLAQELEREMMDPKDRELQETKAELARIKAEKEQEASRKKEEEEKKELDARSNAIKDTLAKKIGEILKDSTLPQDPRTVSKIAAYMQQAMKNKIPYTLEQIRDQVTEDIKGDVRHILGKAEGAQLAEFLGEDLVKKIREWDNARVTKMKSNGKDSIAEQATKKIYGKKKYKTIEEDNLERFGSIYALPDYD